MDTQWHDLFMATAGASGALLGLIFVALSISIAKIISTENLTTIALQLINLLLAILILSIFMLFPRQSFMVLGIEIFLTGSVIWLITFISDLHIYKSFSDAAKKRAYLTNLLVNQAITLLIMASGILIITSGQIGIKMLVFGIIFSFIKGVINSWAILIELNR